MSNPHADIWLHAEAGPDGRVVVKDQFGRKLQGVSAVTVRRAIDEADTLKITCLAGIDGPRVGQDK